MQGCESGAVLSPVTQPNTFFLGRRDDQAIGKWSDFFGDCCRADVATTLLSEVMVWSPYGISLAMASTGPAAPDAMMLAPALGALTSRLRTVHQLNPECWRYTPKGDVDRTAVRKTMVRFP
jgi:hypothetical protein